MSLTADFWPSAPHRRRLTLCVVFFTLAAGLGIWIAKWPDGCEPVTLVEQFQLGLWAGVTYGAAFACLATLGDIAADLFRRDLARHLRGTWRASIAWVIGLFMVHLAGTEFAIRVWGLAFVEPRWLGWFANLVN
jgi:hypothetical protein